jgi:hypothetical protein
MGQRGCVILCSSLGKKKVDIRLTGGGEALMAAAVALFTCGGEKL